MTLSRTFHAMHKAMAMELVKAVVLCIMLELCNSLLNSIAGTTFLPVMDELLYKYNSMEVILIIILNINIINNL